MATIKICPACDAQNPPSAQRCASCSAMLIGVDVTEQSGAPAVPAAAGSTGASLDSAGTAAAASAAAAAQPVPRKCPHADCGQLNPPDAERCLYCNRPMQEGEASAPAALRARLSWPWAEEMEVSERLLIGREAPAPAALAARLEREFSNVSRRHAELVIEAESLWIVDLGSANGTFVNDTRLAPNQRVRLANGARLRFAANLTALVSICNGRS